jgi:hypothetical protein
MASPTRSPSPPELYLNTTKVAERTSFTVKALESLRARGKGPRWRAVGRRVVYLWADVVAWIERGGDK